MEIPLHPLDLRDTEGHWLGIVDLPPDGGSNTLRLPLKGGLHHSGPAEVELRLIEWVDDHDGSVAPSWCIEAATDDMARVPMVFLKGAMCRTPYGVVCDYSDAITRLDRHARALQTEGHD